jgi:hypothetical protein
MSGRRNIKMNFVCDQNWNALKHTANGRYCNLCKKEVFNFTNKTIAEVDRLDKGVCGVFLPEQVEDGLIPIKFSFISKTKYGIATLLTFIGLESQVIKAQNPKEKAKTEMIPESISPDSSDTFDPEVIPEQNFKEDPLANKDSFMRVGRRYLYWTKKFPFITSRRRHWMGSKF